MLLQILAVCSSLSFCDWIGIRLLSRKLLWQIASIHGHFYIESFHDILSYNPITLMYLLIDLMTLHQRTLDLYNPDNVVLHCSSSYFVASDTKSFLDSIVSALLIFQLSWNLIEQYFMTNWARIYFRLTFLFQNHPWMHDILASATVWSVI